MKKFNVIVATVLVGTMLVSCGTTLKKTSDKSEGGVADSVNSVLTMEKTAKPDSEKISVKTEIFYYYTERVFEIAGAENSVAPNSEVKLVITFQRNNNFIPSNYSGRDYSFENNLGVPFSETKIIKANADGSFRVVSELAFYHSYYGGGQFKFIKINLTAQAEGKAESEPIEFDGLAVLGI